MIKTVNLQKIFKTEEVETWALNILSGFYSGIGGNTYFAYTLQCIISIYGSTTFG